MKRDNVPAKIDAMGKYISAQWEKLAKKHELDMHVGGLPSLTHYGFDKDNLLKKTIITQEMLKKGYLAGNSIYVCILHTKKVVDRYMKDLDGVLKMIKSAEDSGDLDKILKGPVCMTGFKRLN
jgi:glutamate-1-semialdehyde 2,1-aminomutase